MESSVMLGSISFFLYNRTSAFFCDGDAPRHLWGTERSVYESVG